MFEELIEEIVKQLERELDEGFENFEGTKNLCPATTVALVAVAVVVAAAG